MAVTSCRHFNGYKPCAPSSGSAAVSSCDEACPAKAIATSSLLIIHLGAIGAVVRATSLLKAIKRKYPGSRVTWVTDIPSDQLLKVHPLIDRVLTTRPEDLLSLSALEFDVAFVVDKSLKAAGVLAQTHADQIFGFQAEARTGAIVPATKAAQELWELGLNNEAKFFKNQKPETQLMIEALELGPFMRDEYDLPLLKGEQKLAEDRRTSWLNDRRFLLGINTGCSAVIPYKKLSIEFHRQIIERVSEQFPNVAMVLLGGPEDTERNAQISAGLPVHVSPTTLGLRDGLTSVAAIDVMLTGDSLGMHLGIATRKQVVAWFGPTCAQEIDLYDRGVKILTKAACAPCWKRLCDKQTLCYDQVSIHDVLEALKRSFAQCQPMSSSKRPFLEICS